MEKSKWKICERFMEKIINSITFSVQSTGNISELNIRFIRENLEENSNAI